MKTLKITLMLALFVVVSSQTDKMPSQKEVNAQEVNMKKSNKIELDLLAHAVRGLRVPTQG